jgi:hypothetical protein
MSGQQRLSREGTRRGINLGVRLEFRIDRLRAPVGRCDHCHLELSGIPDAVCCQPSAAPASVSATGAIIPVTPSVRPAAPAHPLGSDVDHRRGRRRSAVGIANLHDQAGRMMSIGAQVCPPVGVQFFPRRITVGIRSDLRSIHSSLRNWLATSRSPEGKID